jgi:tRNA U55 pseudouridine synthase TruB
LRRTNSGKFTLDRSVTVAQLKEANPEVLMKALISLAEISLMRGA